MKAEAAAAVGIEIQLVELARTTSKRKLLARISELNRASDVHGVIVQLPLDSDHCINEHEVTNAVAEHKDVDGSRRYRPVLCFAFCCLVRS